MSLLDKYVEIPLNKLKPAPWNYKKTEDKDSLEMMENLKNNLKKNKQIENLIVRELPKGMFEVVNGNHRLIALKEIKKKSAVCYNLGKITQPQAERIAIETNETKFERDPFRFAELIGKLATEFDIEELVSTMPMNMEELDNYTKLIKFDWSVYEKNLDDVQDGNSDSITDDDDEWTTVEFRLPVGVAELLQDQISRIKKVLHPDRDEDNVSIVSVMECLVCNVADIPDELLSGE